MDCEHGSGNENVIKPKMGPASKMKKYGIAPEKTTSYPLFSDSLYTSIDDNKRYMRLRLKRIDKVQSRFYEKYLERQSNRPRKMKLLAALTEENIPKIKMKDLKEKALRRECRKRKAVVRLRKLTKDDLKKFMGEENYKIAKREHNRKHPCFDEELQKLYYLIDPSWKEFPFENVPSH